MYKYILVIIVCFAAFLRLYKLSDIPPGVNRDEASIGYTAYSLMVTGRDEYGRKFPLSFESFGDWKLPLYIYTTIPFIKLFGLSDIAVRLPSAFAGIASVVALFYLAKLLFASEKFAIFSSFVLAIMPWHIHISRVESEANVAILFTIVGSILFLNAIRKKALYALVASAIIFSATYYTYHGNHIFTTLLILGLTKFYWNEIFQIKKWWIALITGVILTGFILSFTLLADSTKISGISIFGDPSTIYYNIEVPRSIHDNPNNIFAKLTHNRFTYGAVTIMQNYLKSYGPDFLFIRGGTNNAHNIQGYGNLHPIEAPLLLLGLFWLAKSIKKKEFMLIVWWISIGAVSAAITKDAPHSNRMFAVTPALALTIAAGIAITIKKIPKILFIAGYIACMMIYLDLYFVHFPKNESGSWGYAYKKLTPMLFVPENAHKQIIMSHPEYSPYIYILFYSQFDPSEYQSLAYRYPITRDGITDVAGFGRFSFREIRWHEDMVGTDKLIITKPDEVPDEYKKNITTTISLPNNIKYLVIVQSKP